MTSDRTFRHSKSAAERAARLRACGLEQIRLGGFPDDHPFVLLTVKYVQTLKSPVSQQTYGYMVRDWLRWCRQHQTDPLTADDLDAKAFVTRGDGIAPMTRQTRLGALRAIYASAARKGLVRLNPFLGVELRNVEPVNRTPALSLGEFERTLGRIPRDVGGPGARLRARRDYAMVYLVGRIGLRREELSKLIWSDVQRSDGGVFLRVPGKGEKWERLLLPEDVASTTLGWRDDLSEAIGAGVPATSPVYPGIPQRVWLRGMRPRALSPDSVGRIVHKWLGDAGLDGPRYSTHALRATAATLAHEHGAELVHIQKMLRHASPVTTMRYIRRADADRISAAASWCPGNSRNVPAQGPDVSRGLQDQSTPAPAETEPGETQHGRFSRRLALA